MSMKVSNGGVATEERVGKEGVRGVVSEEERGEADDGEDEEIYDESEEGRTA